VSCDQQTDRQTDRPRYLYLSVTNLTIGRKASVVIRPKVINLQNLFSHRCMLRSNTLCVADPSSCFVQGQLWLE